MVSTEAYTTVADQTRTAVERATDVWTKSTHSLAAQTSRLWQLPQPDALLDATRKYAQYLEDGLQVNTDVTLKVVGAVTTLTEVFRNQLQAFTDFQRGHSKAISTWVSGETETFTDAAKQQTEQLEKAQREQIERAQQAEREREEQARQAERDRAKAQRDEARRARQAARERYEGLTKAELSEELANRELPKTGNVDELIDRLVSADAN
jgi:hypothetical protein